jgi:hypothetical protein
MDRAPFSRLSERLARTLAVRRAGRGAKLLFLRGRAARRSSACGRGWRVIARRRIEFGAARDRPRRSPVRGCRSERAAGGVGRAMGARNDAGTQCAEEKMLLHGENCTCKSFWNSYDYVNSGPWRPWVG